MCTGWECTLHDIIAKYQKKIAKNHSFKENRNKTYIGRNNSVAFFFLQASGECSESKSCTREMVWIVEKDNKCPDQNHISNLLDKMCLDACTRTEYGIPWTKGTQTPSIINSFNFSLEIFISKRFALYRKNHFFQFSFMFCFLLFFVHFLFSLLFIGFRIFSAAEVLLFSVLYAPIESYHNFT